MKIPKCVILSSAIIVIFCSCSFAFNFSNSLGELTDHLTPWNRTGNATYCIKDLGCIRYGDEWYNIRYRPVNVLPSSRAHVATKFFLYNQQLQHRKVQPNAESFQGIDYDATKPTQIIVHGYLGNGKAYWMTGIARALVNVTKGTAFTVGWFKGALPPYLQAVANTRVVALEIANFIRFLQSTFGVKSQDVHVIGHSLGAQICGYVGSEVPGLGRITGLDPAGPLYTQMPAAVRLDSSDALFVDVIHTDSDPTHTVLGFGDIDPGGHLDFYPNNGEIQPGCHVAWAASKLLLKPFKEGSLDETVSCSHYRSIHFFTESIHSKCKFVTFRCSDFFKFLQGECTSCGPNNEDCAEMGLNSKRNPITEGQENKFYLLTAAQHPFCLYHYRIAIDTSNHDPKSVNGYITVQLSGNLASDVVLDVARSAREMEGNKTHTFLATSPTEVGEVTSLQLGWRHEARGLVGNILPCKNCNEPLMVTRIQITMISDYSNNLKTFTFCGERDVSVEIGKSVTFHTGTC